VSEREGRVEGRVAIVTGASRGIGESVALALGREGAAVVLAGRTLHDVPGAQSGSLAEVQARITATGGRALAVRCDVAREDDRTTLVQTAREAFGTVDILVNNAAAFGSASILGVSLKRFRLCFEVNVFACFHLMQLVLPDMIDRGEGWIVNVSSDASRRPPGGPYDGASGEGGAGYGNSKLALEGLTRAVASEVWVNGVAVNALLPSMAVPTPSMLASVPHLDEFVTAESFAEATLRLATCDPATTNGMALYSEDVLHPELGTRGWLSRSM
jgi:NAD(P)-dependent dehydrogenase (short-subunit alcohol dehydrogenase family)